MNLISQIPSVFHGGDDDLNHALAHLSWKEMAIAAGMLLGVFMLILLLVILTN